MMVDLSELCVCVTGVGGGGFGEQILKALRCAQNSYRIVAADMTEQSSGFSLAHIAAALPAACAPDYVDSLLDLCGKNHVQAVFPGSEPELFVLAGHAARFREAGILLPVCPPDVLTLCADKAALFTRLKSSGFHVPWFARIRALADLEALPVFPLVFKPTTVSGGSADVFIVQDSMEAEAFGAYLLRYRGEFVAQEYVGTAEDEYSVGVLRDMEGNFMGSVALHRTLKPALSRRIKVPNRTGRAELGDYLVISSGISQGTLGVYPEICEPCAEIARSLGSTGPINVQCRCAGGKVHVMEINPRFSGTTSIRAMGGFNEPDMLLRRHLKGEESTTPQLVPLTVLRRLEEVVCDGPRSENSSHA
jgi:carbamoyl-phosphate synthase large subunit